MRGCAYACAAYVQGVRQTVVVNRLIRVIIRNHHVSLNVVQRLDDSGLAAGAAGAARASGAARAAKGRGRGGRGGRGGREEKNLTVPSVHLRGARGRAARRTTQKEEGGKRGKKK